MSGIETKTRTVVELVNDAAILYAPVMVSLLRDFPDAHAVRAFIDLEVPTALPKMEALEGYASEYRDEMFEGRASSLLGSLSQARMALLESCPVVSTTGGSLAVSAERRSVEDVKRKRTYRNVDVTASATDGLGAMRMHSTLSADEKGVLTRGVYPSATLKLTGAVFTEADRKSLADACLQGVEKVVDCMLAGGLFLNRDWGLKDTVLVSSWLDGVTLGERVRLDRSGDNIHVVTAWSRIRENLFLFPDDTDRSRSNMSGVITVGNYQPIPDFAPVDLPTPGMP
jgi:hypothetical protein